MRSGSPSASLSKPVSTHTSPVTQSAGLAENTFWAMPFSNVGTAWANAAAGVVMVIVTVIAHIHARRLPGCMRGRVPHRGR